MNEVLQEQLATLLRRFEDTWCRLRPTELRGLWDPEEAQPFYIAEEIAEPMYGWDAIEAYWREAEAILVKFSIRTRDMRCKPVGAEHALMNFIMHWNGILRGMEQSPLGLDVRVSALLRNTAQGWRFCHYVESPLGAFPYLQASYRANVDEDFLD
jgi:hypothetical protein